MSLLGMVSEMKGTRAYLREMDIAADIIRPYVMINLRSPIICHIPTISTFHVYDAP
jgi:hypothetical protein